MHILFIILIGISQVIFCIYLYIMYKKRKEIFLSMEKAEKEAEKRYKDFLIESKNIDEEYEKAKKIFNEEAKRLKNEINSTSGMVKNSLELTLKNLERKRAEIFSNYLNNNLKSLEEPKKINLSQACER